LGATDAQELGLPNLYRRHHGAPIIGLLTLIACGESASDKQGDLDAGGIDTHFPAVDSFAARGAFAVTGDSHADTCTIFHPERLGEEDRRHPVILWGNGTAANPDVYQPLLEHWASHGFIAAAANTSNAGSGKEMLVCLAYLEEQNGTAGSPYADHVDLDHVGSSGHSQGGAGAIMVGADARVSVTVPLQPYIGSIPNGGKFDASSIGEQQGPMLLLSGSQDTIAAPAQNQQPVFDGVIVPVVWATREGADHIFDATGDIGDFRAPATAWFRLHLMDDQRARAWFYGSDCTLCDQTGWQVERKGIE
jgi:hypothetical protein